MTLEIAVSIEEPHSFHVRDTEGLRTRSLCSGSVLVGPARLALDQWGRADSRALGWCEECARIVAGSTTRAARPAPGMVASGRASSSAALPLPKIPPQGLLVSMAIRMDHALALPGYYDMFGPGEHRKRLEAALSTMQQLYEEVSGHGFYSPERESHYCAILLESSGRDSALISAASR